MAMALEIAVFVVIHTVTYRMSGVEPSLPSRDLAQWTHMPSWYIVNGIMTSSTPYTFDGALKYLRILSPVQTGVYAIIIYVLIRRFAKTRASPR
jgi:hypothetical protein